MPRTTIRSEDITDLQVKTDDVATSGITTIKMATDPTNASNLSSGDVPLAQLGNVPETDLTNLEDDIAVLGFQVAAASDLAKYNLRDQIVDTFQDATGVDAGASTNEARSSSGKYYYGDGSVTPNRTGNWQVTAVDGAYTYWQWTTPTASGSFVTDTAQDYEYLVIAGGASGGRQDAGGGGAGGLRANNAYNFPVAAASHVITVGSGGAGKAAPPGPGNDGGNSSFSTISATGGGGGAGVGGAAGRPGGSGGGGASASGGSGPGNVGSYSPVEGYRGGAGAGGNGAGGGGGSGAVGGQGPGPGGNGTANSITGSSVTYAGGGGGGHGGGTSGGSGGGGGSQTNGPGADATGVGSGGGGGGGGAGNGGSGYSGIVIIKALTGPIIGEGGNMTLVSTATTATTANPATGDITLLYTNATGTAAINTDLVASVSRDNGTTYTNATLTAKGSYSGTTLIASAHDIDISGQPAGTSMRWKVVTANQVVGSKVTRLNGMSLGWA